MVRTATVLWLSVVQVIVIALLAALAWPGYSQSASYISELGTASSPMGLLVNLSIALGGLCLGAGAVIWYRLGALDAVLTGGFLVGAAGLIVLAACPLDSSRMAIHGVAANMFYAFAPLTVLATAAYALVAQRYRISVLIAFGCGVLASVGWVMQAADVYEADKGAVQRWIAVFVVAGVCALAVHLNSRAANRPVTDQASSMSS